MMASAVYQRHLVALVLAQGSFLADSVSTGYVSLRLQLDAHRNVDCGWHIVQHNCSCLDVLGQASCHRHVDAN